MDGSNVCDMLQLIFGIIFEKYLNLNEERRKVNDELNYRKTGHFTSPTVK